MTTGICRITLHVENLESRDAPAVTARLDFTYDTGGFFNLPERRAAVERAADTISQLFQDQLSAIVPSGGNSWTASFYNAITDRTVSLNNPIIAANEVVIFVAAGPIRGGDLAVASGGSWSAIGSNAWLNTVGQRGQPPNDIGPWGGLVAFDSDTRWNFGPGKPASNQYDFTSVALHEFLHIFGFGLGDRSFERWISNGTFNGPNAVSVFGGPVPLDVSSDHGHWSASVVSGGQAAIMVPTLPEGEARVLTPVDIAAMVDMGWQLSPISPPPPPPPVITVPKTIPGAGPIRFAVGSGSGIPNTVSALDAAGQAVWTLTPFDSNFTGSVRVATADVTGDGTLDLVVGTGPGTPARVKVIDGRTRATRFDLRPFGDFTGGVYVAAGDITGDGRADIAISPDEGGGPRVRVFSGSTFSQLADFFGIDDSNFRGGARVAIGNMAGLRGADLIVAAGFGGGPRVAGFLGSSLRAGSTPVRAFGDFFAFEQNLRNGVFISSADLNGDGYAELVVGAGPGGGPRVTAFAGLSLIQNRLESIVDYFAGDTSARGGVRVAIADLNGDGVPDLITGGGDNSQAKVTGFAYFRDRPSTSPASILELDVYPGFQNGVFVG